MLLVPGGGASVTRWPVWVKHLTLRGMARKQAGLWSMHRT
jgi:hypothetical protein